METKRKILSRHRQGNKIRAISRELGISRNTVRAIVRSGGMVKISYVRTKQEMPKLGDYTEKLEKMLRDNKNVKPKRTGKAIFEDLRNHGYNGSYSAVSRYINSWKGRSGEDSIKACVPLSFAPGEAYQFDWSSEKVIIEEEVVEVKVAHFVLCYSRKKFIYIYPNETQEMVFNAHVRAFEFFGGTTIRGIYDNMKTAVTKVLRGSDREWNANFERLCAHYLIEPTACTPGSPNEKGQVERQVQIDRDRFFTPMPKGATLQELNDILVSKLITHNSTHKHPEQVEKSLDEVFNEESEFLVSTPILFDSSKETDVRVSVTCLVRFDRNNYSVHCSCAGKVIQCRAYADQVVFIYEGQEVGKHQRRFTKGQTYYNWEHYLPVLKVKPGALRNGAPFMDMELPKELKEVKLHLQQHSKSGTRDFAHILSYIATESMESVVSACGQAIRMSVISREVILNILLRKKEEPTTTEVAHNLVYPTLQHIPAADCNIYNQLLKTGGQ